MQFSPLDSPSICLSFSRIHATKVERDTSFLTYKRIFGSSNSSGKHAIFACLLQNEMFYA